jgi:hypothetical protein
MASFKEDKALRTIIKRSCNGDNNTEIKMKGQNPSNYATRKEWSKLCNRKRVRRKTECWKWEERKNTEKFN